MAVPKDTGTCRMGDAIMILGGAFEEFGDGNIIRELTYVGFNPNISKNRIQVYRSTSRSVQKFWLCKTNCFNTKSLQLDLVWNSIVRCLGHLLNFLRVLFQPLLTRIIMWPADHSNGN